MQPIHVFISSAFSSAALFTHSGSAKKGRAIEIISASPSDSIFSAVSGIFILLEVIKGIDISSFIFFVTQVNAPLGTDVAIVGILDSCQPIPVFIMVAPAFSISLPSCTTSSQELPFSTKSSIESL